MTSTGKKKKERKKRKYKKQEKMGGLDMDLGLTKKSCNVQPREGNVAN